MHTNHSSEEGSTVSLAQIKRTGLYTIAVHVYL